MAVRTLKTKLRGSSLAIPKSRETMTKKITQNKAGWFGVDGVEAGTMKNYFPKEIESELEAIRKRHDWVEHRYDYDQDVTKQQLIGVLQDVISAIGSVSIRLYEEGGAFDNADDPQDITAYFRTIDEMIVFYGLEEIRNSAEFIWNHKFSEQNDEKNRKSNS